MNSETTREKVTHDYNMGKISSSFALTVLEAQFKMTHPEAVLYLFGTVVEA